MAKSLEFLELDFHDPKEVLMAVSYGSVDFRDIGKRKGTSSKTIKMPSTKVNDSFFGLSFNINNEGFFDDKIRVPIKIEEVGFNGTLQLKSIDILNNRPVSYSVNIYSDLADWASLIGEGSIRDLTHHGSHVLSKETVKASNLNNGITGDYCYPLISYGGYLQNLTSTSEINISKFRPAFFRLPILRQIFLEAGFTFIDTDIAQTPFRDEILPFTSKEVEFDDTIFDAEASSDDTSQSASTNIFNNVFHGGTQSKLFLSTIPFVNDDKDDSDIFAHNVSRYFVPEDGTYEVNIDVTLFTRALSTSPILHKELGTHKLAMRRESVGTVYDLGLGASIPLHNSAVAPTLTHQQITVNRSFTWLRGDIITFLSAVTVDGRVNLFKNNTTFSIWNQIGTIKIHPINLPLASGSIINHAKLIPNIKKVDIVRDTIAKGNFRILTDTQRKTVEFIRMDKFLLNETEDWTDKVDHSKGSSIQHIQNMGAKELEWSYSNDGDDLMLKDRTDRLDEPWTRKRVDMESEFRKGTQTVYKSVFSSTIDTTSALGGLSVPVMSKFEPIGIGELDVADIEYDTNFENRTLIYGGMQLGDFNLDGEQQTSYPYAYFSSEDFTLSWITESEVANGTAIGLVDRYWGATIKQLNSSKLGVFWMNLNELDIKNLSFRKTKVINGVHYYLNQVKDYLINANRPTKVELISR